MESTDRIEILSTQLLDQERPLVTDLKRFARRLHLEFGWHYLLDLIWILRHLGPAREKRIVDAGAGVGIMQWHLAERGAEIISVDRLGRADLAIRFRQRFDIQGLREQDLAPLSEAKSRPEGQTPMRVLASGMAERVRSGLNSRRPDTTEPVRGRVILYNQDLKDLPDIPDNSIDAVVAVSALEHNPPDDLALVVGELMRVLKPGAILLATLGAAKDDDWYHVPSSGWCYSEATLRKVFQIAPQIPSNYADYDSILFELRGCRELRKGLAGFYLRSGNNGMPWGYWDPQYQPVGVCKVKPEE
jgi:ubiquinone/menaquinone biosynthesis C-methylase UbiE